MRNVIDMQLIILYLTKHPVWVTNPVQNKLQGKPLGKHGFLNLLIVRLVLSYSVEIESLIFEVVISKNLSVLV